MLVIDCYPNNMINDFKFYLPKEDSNFTFQEGGFDIHDVYYQWAKYTFQKNGKYKPGFEIEIDDKRVRCRTSEPIFDSRPENKPRSRIIYTGTHDIRNRKDEMTFRSVLSCVLTTSGIS